MFLRNDQPDADEKEHRQQATSTIIADLDQILEPYVSSDGSRQREKDLIMLCDRASRVGMILLSQPAVWEFSWSTPARNHRTEQSESTKPSRWPLVIFPGLWRVTDNSARRLEYPQCFLDPKTQS